jgi:superfamily II DNA helicase RecQ
LNRKTFLIENEEFKFDGVQQRIANQASPKSTLTASAIRCTSLYRTIKKSSAIRLMSEQKISKLDLMKIKVFHIRLTKGNLQTDQDNLNNFLDSVTVRKTATELINGQPNFWTILVFYDDKRTENQVNTSNKITVTTDTELTENEKRVFETLKQWRQDKATQLNISTFIGCHNSKLMTIAKAKPINLDALSKIKSFGEQIIAKFGNNIITVLNSI